MDQLDKAFKKMQITIQEGGDEYQRALKALDECLASMIKTEERKQRILRNRLINL